MTDGKLPQGRTAIYARVSTTNGQDVTLQTRELQEYAAIRGWQVTSTYTDEGVSGAKDSRPALNRLMADARRRRFDVLLVWKLDRLGRSLRHLVCTLAELEALGIAFVSLTDNLDLSTPAGRLMFGVIAAMAEFERSLIRERVKAGMRNAKEKGRAVGRPRVSVNAAEIGRLRAAGASWRTICRETGLSKGTAQRAIACLPKRLLESTAVSPCFAAAD